MNSTSLIIIIVMCVSFSALNVCALGNKFLSENASSTLDKLLASNRYDKRIRPSFGGPPVRVSVNFLIKSIGPVSDDDQSFGLDVYFRQEWYDMRLRYKKIPGLDEFSLSWLFLEKVWKPDTYFVNGKKSHLHKITSPNKFLRLRPDGHVTYSMRLTVKASCPMYLRKFPLDSQKCPLILGSYGYPSSEVLYEWSPPDQNGKETKIDLQDGIEISQFELLTVTTEDGTLHERADGSYSTLKVIFWLQRHTGYFLLQVYIPCGLIVLCSWVSFWIDPDDVVARVALAVTTVLSLTTMGFGGRASLPKVSYWTALDWFVIICFTSVFSVMIEYACINFIDKVTKDLKKAIEEKKKEQDELQKKMDLEMPLPTIRHRSASLSCTSKVAEYDNKLIRRKSVNGHSEKVEERKAELPPGPAAQEQPPTMLRKPFASFKKFPRKLSTAVREWIDVPKLQDKFNRSIQNLSRLERGFRDADMDIPRVIVTDEEHVDDITVDMLHNDDSDWVDVDEEEENEAEKRGCNIVERLKLVQLWWMKGWKVLPKEVDVIALMNSPEPPPKFSNIDIGARKNFPIAFFFSLSIYLVAYAYYLTDEFPERDTESSLYTTRE